MAETRRERLSPAARLHLLTETYRELLERYREIERLSGAAERALRDRRPVARVNELLRQKKEILQMIRVEEERVSGAREWWKRFRRSLPAGECRELLSLLDAIARTVERTLAREAECRALLAGSVAWGPPSGGSGVGGAGLAARGAYQQAAVPSTAGGPA